MSTQPTSAPSQPPLHAGSQIACHQCHYWLPDTPDYGVCTRIEASTKFHIAMEYWDKPEDLIVFLRTRNDFFCADWRYKGLSQ
jgi:hypothetical protein